MLTNKEILLESYEIFKENFGSLVGVNLLFMLISMASGFAFGASIILAGPLAVGLALYHIKVRNNENATVSDIFEGFKNFGNSIGAYLLMMVIIIASLFLLLVPGIFMALALSMTIYIVADDFTINPIDAIKKSYHMMNGYKGKYLVLWLVMFLMFIILVPLTLGLALFILPAFFNVVNAVFYEEVRAVYEGEERVSEIDMIGA